MEGLDRPVKTALTQARNFAEEVNGSSIPHRFIMSTREKLRNAIGRFTEGTRTIELSKEHHAKNPAEAFTSYSHELSHAIGIWDEGAAEWLAQKAATLNGYTTQGVAYLSRFRAFDELAKLVSPVVSDARAHFAHMLKFAQESKFGRHGNTVQALRKQGYDSTAAQAKAGELLEAIR
jgi:hypothetical protein